MRAIKIRGLNRCMPAPWVICASATWLVGSSSACISDHALVTSPAAREVGTGSRHFPFLNVLKKMQLNNPEGIDPVEAMTTLQAGFVRTGSLDQPKWRLELETRSPRKEGGDWVDNSDLPASLIIDGVDTSRLNLYGRQPTEEPSLGIRLRVNNVAGEEKTHIVYDTKTQKFLYLDEGAFDAQGLTNTPVYKVIERSNQQVIPSAESEDHAVRAMHHLATITNQALQLDNAQVSDVFRSFKVSID